MITQSIVRRLFHYSPATGILTYAETRDRCRAGAMVGTTLPNGYLRTFIAYKSYYVHRLIFLYEYGYIPREIDHANGVKVDNRLVNLRECKRTGNEGNKFLRSNNTSGFKGVFRHGDKWYAKLSNYYLGMFPTREDAARAYDKAAMIHYGDFARTNEKLGLFS